MNTFKPMLAATLLPPSVEHTDELVYDAMKKLKYPVLASLKMDGIRGIKHDFLYSRRLKLIPNVSLLIRARQLPFGFDMELFNPALQYNEIESIVMSEVHAKSSEIQFHILDMFHPTRTYEQRLYDARHMLGQTGTCDAWAGVSDKLLAPVECSNANMLLQFFLAVEKTKGEGICFRLPSSPYKQGRSTLREQYLVKLARYTRTEAVIVGFEEQMENGNREKRDSMGKMDRQTLKCRMTGKETLGAFLVKDSNGLEFRVGTGVGLTDKLREKIWLNQDVYLGKTIVVKSKSHGKLVKPRSPIYIGFRNEIDI